MIEGSCKALLAASLLFPLSLFSSTFSDPMFSGFLSLFIVSNVTKQLEDGIRLLQLQGHPFGDASEENPSGISNCHTSCYLEDGGYVSSELSLERYYKQQGWPLCTRANLTRLSLQLSSAARNLSYGRQDLARQESK